MKGHKYASQDELQKFYGDKVWEQKYWESSSPLNQVSLPPNSVFVVGSGCASYMSCVSVSFIGLEVVRSDVNDAPNIWNIDRYEIYNQPSQAGTFLIKGPIKSMDYHHTNSIPSGIYNSLPPTIKQKVDGIQYKINFADTEKKTKD